MYTACSRLQHAHAQGFQIQLSENVSYQPTQVPNLSREKKKKELSIISERVYIVDSHL